MGERTRSASEAVHRIVMSSRTASEASSSVGERTCKASEASQRIVAASRAAWEAGETTSMRATPWFVPSIDRGQGTLLCARVLQY